MATPSFKVSERFTLGDLVVLQDKTPRNPRNEFGTISWGKQADATKGSFVVIATLDDADATLEIYPRGATNIGSFWVCHRWVEATTATNSLIDDAEEGQRQLDFAKKRGDFHARVRFGWLPPPEELRSDGYFTHSASITELECASVTE